MQLKGLQYLIDPSDNKTYLEDSRSNKFGFKDGNNIVMFDANENGQLQYNLQDIDTMSCKDQICIVVTNDGRTFEHHKRIDIQVVDLNQIDYTRNDLNNTINIIKQQYPSWIEDLYLDDIDGRIHINPRMFGDEDGIKTYDADGSDLLAILDQLCQLIQTVTENGKTRTVRFKPIKQIVDDAIQRLALLNRRNSFIHMISRVKWDGKPRIDTFLFNVGCRAHNLTKDYDAELYLRFVSRGIFLVPIDRSVNTEYRSIPFMPILIGEQGSGKSWLCRRLGLDWYRGTTESLDDDKRFYESSSGSVILELIEGTQFNRSSTEMMKAFIERDRLQFRKSYAHNEMTIPIRFMAIATTNNLQPLTDGSGNRRFYPVYKIRTGGKEIWDYSDEDILQLWAEAYKMYNDGVRWNDDLEDPNMVRIFKTMQEDVTSLSPPFDELKDYLNQNYPNVGDRVSNKEIHEFLEAHGWYGKDADNKIRTFSRSYALGLGFRSINATPINGVKARGFERINAVME